MKKTNKQTNRETVIYQSGVERRRRVGCCSAEWNVGLSGSSSSGRVDTGCRLVVDGVSRLERSRREGVKQTRGGPWTSSWTAATNARRGAGQVDGSRLRRLGTHRQREACVDSGSTGCRQSTTTTTGNYHSSSSNSIMDTHAAARHATDTLNYTSTPPAHAARTATTCNPCTAGSD